MLEQELTKVVSFMKYLYKYREEGTASFYFFIYWFSERRGERGTPICCPTYLYTHWLVFECAPTRDQTHNLGVLGECSNRVIWPGQGTTNFHPELRYILIIFTSIYIIYLNRYHDISVTIVFHFIFYFLQAQVFIARCQLNKLGGQYIHNKGDHQLSWNFFLERGRNHNDLDWEKINRDKLIYFGTEIRFSCYFTINTRATIIK